MTLRQRLFQSKLSLAMRLVRWLLRIASLPYAQVMRLRNLAYDWGLLKSHRVDLPVICVGNLSVGGTGKTPMVAWLCGWLREQSLRVAIVSRGYGQLEGGSNDEALELELALPDVPHLQNADRVAATRLALEELDMQVVVLDDGFQHRRLERHCDIVMIDASEPAATGWCLPGGLLREPWSGLRRAAIVVLTRSDLATVQRLEQLQALVARYAPDALCLSSRTQPVGWHGDRLPFQALDALGGKQVLAFAGIGNPNAFYRTLEQLGLIVAEHRTFPDHHAYTASDVEQLSAWCNSHGEAAAVVCTMKDWVKLQTARLGPLPLAALKVGMDFGDNTTLLIERLTNEAGLFSTQNM